MWSLASSAVRGVANGVRSTVSGIGADPTVLAAVSAVEGTVCDLLEGVVVVDSDGSSRLVIPVAHDSVNSLADKRLDSDIAEIDKPLDTDKVEIDNDEIDNDEINKETPRDDVVESNSNSDDVEPTRDVDALTEKILANSQIVELELARDELIARCQNIIADIARPANEDSNGDENNNTAKANLTDLLTAAVMALNEHSKIVRQRNANKH